MWSDIEVFLHKTGAVIRQLEQKMETEGARGRKVKDALQRLDDDLAAYALRRKRAQDFLIDGTLSRADYDRQIMRISETEARIHKEQSELRKIEAEQDATAVALDKARSVLEEYRAKVQGKLTFAKKRAIVERLVSGITVTPRDGREPEISITFRFQSHAERYIRQFQEETAGLAPIYAGT